MTYTSLKSPENRDYTYDLNVVTIGIEQITVKVGNI